MFLNDYNKTAVIYADNKITYNDVIRKANAYAASYRIKKGDRVAIYSENRPEWIYALYSIWINKGILVPLDASANEDDIAYILKDSKPAHIFCTSEGSVKLKQILSRKKIAAKLLIFSSIDKPVAKISDKPFAGGAADDTAVIMYTSGTTDAPKGVMLSYGNLEASIRGISDLKMMTADDTIIGLLPFHHILPLQGTVIAPLYLGTTIVLVTSLTAADIMAALQKHKVTMFLGVPKLYELFHNGIINKINANIITKLLFMLMKQINSNTLGRNVFSKVHKAFGGHVHSYLTGGAAMDKNVMRDLWALGFPIVEGYGLTETAPLVAFNPRDNIKPGSVGRPLAGTDVKFENGEILVRGANVMKGYYRNPAATAKKIKDGWFHTGDLGEIDKDGYLYIKGRTDDMIVLPSGKNINPEEIEKKLLSSKYIKDIGIFLDKGNLSGVIQPDLVSLGKDGIANIAETIKWKIVDNYNKGVAAYKKIFDIKIIHSELPRTRLGKLKRYLLPGLTAANAASGIHEPDPALPEYKIIKTFLKTISKTEVYPEYHLELDLGLDSLSKVELLVFIEYAFGIEINEDDLVQYPTVKMLSEFVSSQKTTAGKTTVKWSAILKDTVPFTKHDGINFFTIIKKLTKPLLTKYFQIHFHGIENIMQSPVILTPNHQSFFDVLLLCYAFDEKIMQNTYFIARKSLARRAIVRSLMEKANIIFVNFDKDIKASLKKSASVLKSGSNLVIFPEGHRTRDGKISQFKKSFAILASELGIPVVPVAIKGAYEALPTGNKIPRRCNIDITFFKPEFSKSKNYQVFADKVKTVIENEVTKS